jgi:hypothetical protein
MKQAAQPFRRFKFGVFEADLRTGELTKFGKRVRLGFRESLAEREGLSAVGSGKPRNPMK